MKRRFYLIILLLLTFGIQVSTFANERKRYNFNSGWLLHIGDEQAASAADYNDKRWKKVDLPRAFNEDEAFRVAIAQLTDTVVWYRKHFNVDEVAAGKKVFVEFEGIRFGGEFYLNGQNLGLHENGVMAVGFDLTPYIKAGDNVLAVRIDNDWQYRERSSNTRYQWNDRNFNANYGGIPKNVFLHITDKVYQTLPLYSSLKTTGVYVYADQFDIPGRKAIIHTESQVKNDSSEPCTLSYHVSVADADGVTVKEFDGEHITLQPGEMRTMKAAQAIGGLHFWSWGYGYLYIVKTSLKDAQGNVIDEVATRTGFRKTRFAEGKVWLNDRVLQMKGYAQRTSNEWPAVGMSVPAWLSDYSNGLMVEGNANLVRWMHVTPWKQDVESCDRVGLIQAMPAGDSEKDRTGRQWQHRVDLMRDAIVYNRNNPSILFYECGNESISREHMLEMKAMRDLFDPHGGRAIGSREMLDINEAEYGGEMLYVNKSKKHPMWATEYCRDEGLRKYWDEYSYPFHKEGDGNSEYLSTVTNLKKKGMDARNYNHNQDMFTVELVRRWYDYWRERPGTGERVSSGGTKIIFSDSNTHYRGVENYRRSGVTDPLRIPKDGFFAHQVMWNGWVDTEAYQTYIVGHWNYDEGTVKPLYVVSNGDEVELLLNGKSLGKGKREYDFLFTFDKVTYAPGKLEAISYKDGKEVSRYALTTAGEPAAIKLTTIQNPEGFHADGADLALVQVEVVDAEGRRCPLDNRTINFSLKGEGEWRGGLAQGPDNYILSKQLPVECGVNRAIIRSTRRAGKIVVKASAKGLPTATVELKTVPVEVKNGLSEYIPAETLKGWLTRGETPATPSYTDTKRAVPILGATAGSNQDDAFLSFDDNELSEWSSDGQLNSAWITYTLAEKAAVDDICIKLTGWRQRSYPLEVYAGETLIWRGDTEKSLGYVHLHIEKPVSTDRITIRLKGATTDRDAFGQIVEVAGGPANELDRRQNSKQELRIVEVEFLQHIAK